MDGHTCFKETSHIEPDDQQAVDVRLKYVRLNVSRLPLTDVYPQPPTTSDISIPSGISSLWGQRQQAIDAQHRKARCR